MREAPGAHDPTFLPPDIPVPQDDGAARHLAGMKLPDIALPATSGGDVQSGAACRPHRPLHLSAYRRAGGRRCRRAGTTSPVRAAARRNPAASATILPSSKGWASPTCSASRPRIPATSARSPSGCTCRSPILSDAKLALTRALKLPTFTTSGMTLLKRMALVVDDGVIAKVFYPVFPPDKNAAEVIAWLRGGG